MQPEIDAASVVSFHDRQLRERDWPMLSHAQPGASLWQAIDAGHRYNGLLQREELRAQRTGASSDDIAAAKRLIDRYQGRRQDAVEAIDDALLAAFAGVTRLPGARLHSETAGAMIDRLSVLAVKAHHLRARCGPADPGAGLDACAAGLERLAAQRADLMSCLDALLHDVQAGCAWFNPCPQVRITDTPAPDSWRHGRTQAQAQTPAQSTALARAGAGRAP